MQISVTTCGKYQDQTMPLFDRFFKKNYGDEPYGVVSDTHSPKGWFVFNGTWSDIMLGYCDLLESHGINHVLLLMDDYLLADKVDKERIERYAKFIDDNPEVGFIRLNNCPGPTLPYREDLGKFDPRQPYAISLQPTIFRVDFLKKTIKHDESVWDYEIKGSERGYPEGYIGLGTYETLMPVQNMLDRGKIRDGVVEWIRRQDA